MPALTAPPKYQRRPDRVRPPRASPAPSSSRARSRSSTPAGPPRCSHCNAATLAHEEGGLVCQTCGVINEADSNFRAEVEFDESASGAVKTRGTHIGAHQSHSRTYTSRVASAAHVGQEATKASERARGDALHKVQHFATFLRIRDPEVDRAMYLFEQAYNRQFYRGRTLEAVAIVCLYLAIRQCSSRDRYALMLIDFAELSQGGYNVFELGKMAKVLQQMLYLDASRERWWSLERQKTGATDEQRQQWENEQSNLYKGKDMLSLQDPEDLIERFCEKLDFSDDVNAIKRDAAKIAQSMNRDWMTTGRRPAGIAGAAVILAARMNNYRRTLREVVLVAKVTEITLSKRIEEFKETRSSTMSVQDFRATDPDSIQGTEVSNPPAYYKAQPEWKEKQAAKKGKRKRKKGQAQVSAAALENDEDEQSEEDTDAEEDGHDETRTQNGLDDVAPPAKRPRLDADGFAVPDIPTRASQQTPNDSSQPAKRKAGRPAGAKNWAPRPLTEAEEEDERVLESEIQEQLNINAELDATGEQVRIASATPEPQSAPVHGRQITEIRDLRRQTNDLQATEAVRLPRPPIREVSMDETLGNDEFEDDPDVANCLLNEQERIFKETVWVEENKDWLRTEHAKRIKRELKDRELREKGIDPDKERMKKLRRKDGMQRAGRAGDVSYLDEQRNRDVSANGENDHRSVSMEARNSVQVMMQQRGTFSRRVDYDKLSQAYVLPGYDDSESRSESPVQPSSSFYRPAAGRGTQNSMLRRARATAGRIAGAYDTEDETDVERTSPGRNEDDEVEEGVNEEEVINAPTSQRQLPTPVATQVQQRESPEATESPLSSTHTPAGYSGAPNTPQPSQLRTEVGQDDEESEGDEDDYIDDDDDPGDNLDSVFNAGGEFAGEEEEVVDDD